ncbi:MAG: cysteine hydrolase [Dehalococcoidia bacterium]|nr:cysteine hydrolase [Dehalococcoidia bacterium]
MSSLPIEPARTALLVMDCDNDVVHPKGGSAFWQQVQERDILAHIRHTLDGARSKGVTVIYVVASFRADYADIGAYPELLQRVKGRGALKEGTWGTQVHEAIAPLPQDFIVHKKRVSAFYGTDLEVVLRTRRIDTLALTGVSTNFVVESTARYGSDAGYRVIVLEDCCSAASPDMHSFAARKVLPMLCTVASSQDFLAGLGTSK